MPHWVYYKGGAGNSGPELGPKTRCSFGLCSFAPGLCIPTPGIFLHSSQRITSTSSRSQHEVLRKAGVLSYITGYMIDTSSDSFEDQTAAANDSHNGARDNRARGRARQRARPRDEHRQRQGLARPLHGDEQAAAPSTDIKMQTTAPLTSDSETPAAAPCPSSERQAAPPQNRSRPRRQGRKQGGASGAPRPSSCRFCLADVPAAAVRCRRCTSILNHTAWRRRGGRHISTANQTTGDRQRTVGARASGPIHGQEQRAQGGALRRPTPTDPVHMRPTRTNAGAEPEKASPQQHRSQGGVGRGRTAAALGTLHVPCHATARAGVG